MTCCPFLVELCKKQVFALVAARVFKASKRQHASIPATRPNQLANWSSPGCAGSVFVYYKRVKGTHPMRSTTKAQALEQFRYNWKCETKGTKMATDSIAKRLSWSYFTDALCKEGYITMKKYESWSNPF